MQICLYEDTSCTSLYPLVYLRPVYELRCGVFTLREKIGRLMPRAKTALFTRPELRMVTEEENPGLRVNQLDEEPTWFVNGRTLVDDELKKIVSARHPGEALFRHDGDIVAAFVSASRLKTLSTRIDSFHDQDFFQDLPQRTVSTTLVKYPWDIIRYNHRELERDFTTLRRSASRKISLRGFRGAHFLNPRDIIIGRNTCIQPGAVLDAGQGPVMIGPDAHIMPNAVLQGPVYIGNSSIVKIGAKIYPGTSIGTMCKVGGEIDGAVIHSYSNKQHDGFLGHSYLGSWINIGADTNTSDLKNTYGPVTVVLDGKPFQTGMQFLGLVMGDHSKTGINVTLNTGSVIGVSCNIFGPELPPKFLPSFSWGRGTSFETYDVEKSLETARRVMARRNVRLTPSYESLFRDLFRQTAGLRTPQGDVR